MQKILNRIVLLLGMGALALAAASLRAQEFPTKPLRIIIPNNAGTIADLMARIMVPEWSRLLGQPVVIEAKPGASMVIGLEYVAKQVPADGYTIAFVSVSSLPALPVTVKDLRFDPFKDLPPFIGVSEGKLIVGTSSNQPWKTFNELVAYAKSNPGKLNYGASSPSSRIPMEVVIRGNGLNVVHVPYAGAAPQYQGMLSGDVAMGMITESAAQSFGDKMRIIAVTGKQRSAMFPDAPTFTELGFPQLRGSSFSMSVPAGTPKPVFDKLHATASRTLQHPDVKAGFDKLRYDITNTPPDETAKNIADEAKIFADIAREIGLKPQ